METVNELVETASWRAWIGRGVGAAVVGVGATLVLTGVGDLVALGLGTAGLFGALAASMWRRRLDALPLQLADRVAVSYTPSGRAQHTARVWLGRGRRVDAIEVHVRQGGRELEPLLAAPPMVGCFQVVFFPISADPVEVRVAVRCEDSHFDAARVFDEQDRCDGRFSRAFDWSQGRWSWRRAHWGQIE